MADFSTFEYGTGVVYGPSSFSVKLLTDNVLRLELDTLAVVVDSAYKDVANYTVTPDGSSTSLTIKRVLVPKDTRVVNYVDLLIEPPAFGAVYLVAVQNLRYRAGGNLSAGGWFKSRNTKATAVTNSVPRHFNRDPESAMGALLSAIGIADDLIGGSRNDTF